LQHGVSPDDGVGLAKLLERHTVELVSPGELRVDGIDRAPLLSAPEVSDATSKASVFPVVRAFLLAAQRNAFPGQPLIAEGRDMGTVVFPDAPLKFFIEASVAVRAARRLKQLFAERGVAYDPAVIEHEIVSRDRRDSERALSPTRAAPDAVVIDNSNRPLDATVMLMRGEVDRRGLTPP
jgi:cytidylate kinase